MLCFVMAWGTVIPAYAGTYNPVKNMDEAAIKAKYPNAKIIHVSEEEYPELAEKLQKQGYQRSNTKPVQQLATSESYPQVIQAAEDINHNRMPTANRDDCGNSNYRENKSASDSSLRVMVDFSSDMMNSKSDGDGAAVLFVFIGAVLLVVWTLYIFKYLYDVSMGYHPCRWSELSVSSSRISSETDQYANFHGLNYKTGIRNGITEFGISAEIGHSDIILVESGALRLEGLYWLIGPLLRWRLSPGINSHYFQMDFLAGSTEHAEVGVIARANMGLRFGISETMHMSFNWGAMNINLNENQGIINTRKQYYYLYGINVGYRF